MVGKGGGLQRKLAKIHVDRDTGRITEITERVITSTCEKQNGAGGEPHPPNHPHSSDTVKG